jgi:VanZ family protein
MSIGLVRAIAWLYAAVLVFLTLGSPGYRFETVLPHNVEHLVAFSISGLLFSIGYRSRPLVVSLALVSLAGIGFVAALEVFQIWMAGRHARWIDFAMDALGFCIGVGVDLIVSRVRDRLTAH